MQAHPDNNYVGVSKMTIPPEAHDEPPQEFEGPFEVFEPIEKFRKIQKFFRTRKEILAGEALYREGKKSLESRQLMGAWKFNLTQSFLCSLPGSLLAAILAYFPAPAAEQSAAGQDVLTKQILSLLTPYTFPFALMFTVFAAAYCSLPGDTLNRTNWHAAQRKYLYLDGAFGLYSQFLLATGIAVATLSKYSSPTLHAIGGIGAICFLIAFVWQGVITAFKIREGMFDYDYLPRSGMFESLNEPPLFKFYLLLVFSVFVIFAILSVVETAIATLLATGIHHLRGS